VSGLRAEVGAPKVHPNRLRFMYVYTILTGGVLGFALLTSATTCSASTSSNVEKPSSHRRFFYSAKLYEDPKIHPNLTEPMIEQKMT
jgi:hypothetical protein